MNAPLVALAVGAIVLGFAAHAGWGNGGVDWFKDIVSHSSANPVTLPVDAAYGVEHAGDHAADAHHASIAGMDPHFFMIVLSSILAVAGIALAAFFFWINRELTAKLAKTFAPIVTLLENKYYIDELYDVVFVHPLKRLGGLFYVVDVLIINNLLSFVAWVPTMVGRGVRPAQSGRLSAYSLGMAMGIAVFALLIFMAVNR